MRFLCRPCHVFVALDRRAPLDTELWDCATSAIWPPCRFPSAACCGGRWFAHTFVFGRRRHDKSDNMGSGHFGTTQLFRTIGHSGRTF